MEVCLTAQGNANEDSGRFRMDSRSSLNFTALGCLNIRKFCLMSRGLEERGGDQKVSHTQYFTNFIQTVEGDGDAAVDQRMQELWTL